METERMALSQRERDRLRVLHEVKQKQIKQVEAARRLKITDRHVRRLLVRLGEKGDGAVIHGLRGRPSNRRLAARLEQKILARVHPRFGVTSSQLPVLLLFQTAKAAFPSPCSRLILDASGAPPQVASTR